MSTEVTGAEITDMALQTSLQIAVPLMLAELDQLSPQARQRRLAQWGGDDTANLLAFCGDMLLARQQRARRDGGHGGRCLDWQRQHPDHTMRPGDCPCQLRSADLWTRCAHAVVVLAHLPGGVDFAGMHWEVT